jgi:hypothetical protein
MGTKILTVYSTVTTTLLAIFALAGFAAPKVQRFDEIDVHRINVREADGTLRMVISNQGRLPGVIERGKEHAKVDRPYAGMLFYNDEATENGVSYSAVAVTPTEKSSTLERAFRLIVTARTLKLFSSRV